MSEFLDLVNNLRTSNQQVAISSSADPANDFGNDAVRNVAIALQTGQQANSVNFDLAKSYITRFCHSSVSSSGLYNVSDAAKPSFNYARNSISIPSRSANPGLYNDKGAFYNQIFHEVSHYTRAQLGISGVISGTPEYQKEEVIAEMTACKMMMNCGFPVDNLRTSARYIDAWANEYVKNLPEAEKAAAKAELLSDAEKSADEALKLVHLNIGMNQRYETNQDLKMRLIVPADEVKLALARGVRQDEKGYYVRISDDFSKFERWSEKNMLETAIQYSRKAVNEAAPEIRQDKENELNTAIQEAQKQAEAEEAQKASVVTSSADNIDQREEISVASSEQSNAPNVPDSNSVNASLIAEIQRMQQQLAELQKQLAATQKENEELRNGQHQQRAEAGRARENSANRNDIKHTDDEAGTGSMEMERGHFQDGGSEPLEGIQPEMGGEDISGLRSRSGSISAGRSRNAGSMGSDRSNALSGEDGGSIGNHTHAGSRRSGGAEENEGTDDADRLSESRNVSTESDRHEPGRNRDGSVSGRRSSGTLSADGTQEQVRSGNNFRQGDVSGSEHSDNDGIHGIRDRSGNVDLSMVDKARSGAPEEAVLPGEHTGARGETAGVSPVSGNTGFESVNRGSDAGVFQSAGGGARSSVRNTGALGDDGNSLSDGTYGNERAENADSVSAGSSQLVEESGLRRSGELQGEHGRGQVLHDRGDVTTANNANANEPDDQEVRPVTKEYFLKTAIYHALLHYYKTGLESSDLPSFENTKEAIEAIYSNIHGINNPDEYFAKPYYKSTLEVIEKTQKEHTLSLYYTNEVLDKIRESARKTVNDNSIFSEKGMTETLSHLNAFYNGYDDGYHRYPAKYDDFIKYVDEYESLGKIPLTEKEKSEMIKVWVEYWVDFQLNHDEERLFSDPDDNRKPIINSQIAELINKAILEFKENPHEIIERNAEKLISFFHDKLYDIVYKNISEEGLEPFAKIAHISHSAEYEHQIGYEFDKIYDEIDKHYLQHETEINDAITEHLKITFPRTQEQYDSLSLTGQEKEEILKDVIKNWVDLQGYSEAGLKDPNYFPFARRFVFDKVMTYQTADLIYKPRASENTDAEQYFRDKLADIVSENLTEEGLKYLAKYAKTPKGSPFYEAAQNDISFVIDEIDNWYQGYENQINDSLRDRLERQQESATIENAETDKAVNTENQSETQTDGVFPRTQEEYDSLRNVQLSEQEKHDAVEIAVTEWVSWQENPDSSAAVLTEQTSALIDTHEHHQQFENILIDRVTEQLSEAGWASLAQFARTPVESPFYEASRYEALEEVLDEIDVIYREHEAEINNSLTPVNEQQADIQASQPETSSAPAEKQETQNNSGTVTDEYFLKNVIYHSILECVDFNITEGNNQLITAKMYLDGTLHHQDIKDSTERKLKDHVDAIYDAIKNVYDPRGYDRRDEEQISNAVREILGTDENLYRNFRYVNNRIVNRVIASVRDNHLFNAEAMQEIIGEMHESHSGYPTYDEVLANLAKLEQALSDESTTEKAENTVNQPEPQETAQKSEEQPEEIKPEESQPENSVSEQQDIPLSETANAADEQTETAHSAAEAQVTEKDPFEDLEYLYRTGQFSDDDARLRTSVYLIKNINFVNHPLSGDFGFWSYDFNDKRLYQNTYKVQAGFQGTSDEIPNNFSRYFYNDLNRRFGVTQNSDAVKAELEKVFSNIMPDLRFKHQNNLVNDELPEIKEKRAKKSRKKKDSDQIDLFDDAQTQTEMQETAQHEPVSSSAVSDKQQSDAPVTDSTKQEPAFSISDNWEIPEADNTQTEKPTSLERFNRNISAIETLRKIQNEGDRAATKEEQAILAQFSGWGGLLSHLHLTENSSNADKERYEKLRTLLGDEEFNKAQTSALTAFYTDPEIARTIYKGLEQAGFKGGNILEPSCGTGVFFGVMPREMMANSELHGIELEPITGAIAQKLYPSADIRICGYEKSGQQNNNFDVVIGNVPFGNFSVTDPRYMKDHDDIHNYFINKSLDQVKPGGIVAVITSSATLEDKDPAFREKIAEKAELMGAIRLPDYAFQNSGTDVKTDILFLKKRKQPIQREDAAKEIWVNTKQFEYGSKGYSFQCFDRDSSYDGDEKSRFKSFKINRNWMIDHAPSCKDITDEYGRVMSKEQRQREKAVDKINLPTLNEYYRQNSDMIIGGYESVSFNRYGQVSLDSGSVDNLKEELTNSLNHITGIFEAEKTEKSNTPKLNPWDFPDVKPNSFFLLNDKAYFKGIDDVTPVASDFEAPVKSFINLKNSFDSVINGMINEVSDNDLSTMQQTLRDDYFELRNVCNMKSEDKDLPLFSIIGSGGKKSKNKENAYEDAVKFLKKDVSFGRLQTLEITDKVFETVINKKGIEEIKTKVLLKELSPITSKRTLNKQEIVRANTSNEALYLSLGNKGVVDFDYMSKISSISPAALVKELQDGGQIFRDPSKHGSMYENWIPKEEFLSGDIIDKIDQTRKRMNEDLSFEKELSALKKVLPQEKKFDEMDISISSPFVPTDIVGRFLDREFDGYGNKVVKDGSGKFHVDIGVNDYSKVKSYTVDGLDLDDVVQKFLNHDIIKNDCVKNDENAFRTVNHIYRKRFEEHFDNFVKNELTPDDKKRIENNYNKSLNRNVPRKYDGSFLNFAGMNTDKIKLRTHQINTVARGIFGGNTMIAHEVGAGKTYTMIATAMEMKRMGICKKPVITVPNAVLDQWEKDFHDLYPQANVLKVTSEDMKSENIVSTAAKMAYNDWDAIIISHKNLQKIPVSQSVIDMVKTRRQDEILEVAESSDLGIRAERKWIEQENDNLEKLITNIQNKYKDSGCPLTIDEIGIDRLFVDESHMYKNLPIDTTMGSIVGLSKGGSALAQEMEFKTAYFNEKTNYKGVIFASGTPVSNTLGEMYSLQKFLQPQVLRKAGITNFHIWTDNFVNIELDKQVNMTGQGLNVKLVMKEFKNLDGLLNMFWQTGDFVTTKSLVGKEGFVLPDVERESVIIEPTQGQENLINAIEQRMAVIEAGNVDPKKDNKLCVAGDSRKIGLDPRLLSDANLDRMNMTKSEAGKGVKIEKVAENVFNIWEETKDKRSTQVIFCDLGTPKKSGKKGGNQFTVYDELKQQFIDRGVPANEIALIHDYDDEAKKEILFQSVNKGDIRIVIGSTEKLGTGCNFQKKLIAAHHVDAPWRPSDFTQREGRIVRQKNENKTVKIFTYATKKTFDAYMFDTLARKQEYISALFSGQEKSRRIEDLKDVKLDYKKMRTITCGSEKLKAKLDLMDLMEEYVNAKKTEEQKLKNLSDNTLFAIPNRINACNSNIAKLEHVSDIKNANPIRFNEKKEKIFPGFRKPDGTFIDDKKEFMDYLTSKAPTDSLIGNYRGFPVYLYERRDDTGKMARKVAIAPSEFEERVPMMRYGNDVANITSVFPAIDNNWDHRIDYFEYQLNESREQLAKFEKELQDSDLSKKSIEKEIQHYDDLINECNQKLSELDAEELDEKAFVDINNVDPSSLKDVACEEEEETEESNYSLPEGYEEQYYEPAGQEALDLMPEEDKRHYIDVPFNEKNEAKALGAKWDQENKGWYVPEGINMADFAKWPEKQKSEMPARDYIKVPMKDKDEAKALGARWDKDNKLWFIPKNANADLFAKWPRTTIAEKKAEQERKPVYSPRVTLYVPFSRKDEAKKLGAYWDARSKQWTCKAEDKAKFSEFLKPLPKTESKVRENTDRINHEPNVQSAMLRDLASAGVRIDAVSIQNTGKWIRVPLIDDKPGEKTGMLAIHLDGVPTMKFVNFRHPELSIPMNTENKVRLYVGDLEQIKQSPQTEERLKTVTEEAKARIAANQAAREAEREKAQKSAQAKSEYFSQMPPASENSQYLVSKGIKPSPDLHQNQKSGDLFVPFYDADGQIKTTQIIHADGRKQFIEGGQKGGAFHPLDGIQSLAERDTIYICEGYATANTIREATKEKMAVVAAGDCGNLLSVATAIHEKFPEKAIVIAGDDDRFNEVNSGRNHAESTARAIGATVVFPDFDGNSTGTDFNDMAKEKGIEAVREVLRNEYRQHRATAEEAAPEKQPEKAKKPGYRR